MHDLLPTTLCKLGDAMVMTSPLGSASALSPHRRVFIPVTCFVDWNSQLLNTGIHYETKPVEAARAAFRQVTRKIAQCLVKVDDGEKFQVHLRLYHGWRKGYAETANLKAIRTIIAETDFSTASDKPSVVYSNNITFGDCLLSALPRRMHQKLGIHLPNTCRKDRSSEGREEKMVDTALAADLVVCAYQDPNDWILLVTEDDDLIPPLFTAESIINLTQARALLLSKRKRSNNMLLLDGLDVS